MSIFCRGLEEFRTWRAVYHKSTHQFAGIEKRKLATRVRGPDVGIGFEVSLDRMAVGFCGDENDRTQPLRNP
jgi:hypothetical protein